MNKQELVTRLAKTMKTSKINAEGFLNAFTSEVQVNLKRGQPVKLIGFGTFQTGKRQARMGRNPQTGESIKIPATKVVKFKAHQTLKSYVK